MNRKAMQLEHIIVLSITLLAMGFIGFIILRSMGVLG